MYDAKAVRDPRETLRAILSYHKIGTCQLSFMLNESETYLDYLIDGRSGIDVNVAVKLERLFGIPADYWMG